MKIVMKLLKRKLQKEDYYNNKKYNKTGKGIINKKLIQLLIKLMMKMIIINIVKGLKE